jgi:uncharacterized protein with FMN-binding domain
MNTKTSINILALVIVILAGSGYAYTRVSNKDASTRQSPGVTSPTGASTPNDPSEVVATALSSTAKYKNGTYAASGSYQVPEGKTESISVSLTLKDDVIVDASVSGSMRDHDSRRFTNQFILGYKSQVIGKSIDEANLSIVSGASLTGAGWNSALESIKAQAAV